MSATHFSAMPVIALQLAVQTEKYRHAIETESAGRADGGGHISADVMREASKLALVIAALWADWGRLMVAHNQLIHQQLQAPRSDAARQALRRVTALADAFTTRCVHWALFEQPRPSVPFHTADAFIAWEGARRSARQLREQIETFLDDSKSTEVPKTLDDMTLQAERNANRLLVQAVMFLEGNEGAAESAAD